MLVYAALLKYAKYQQVVDFTSSSTVCRLFSSATDRWLCEYTWSFVCRWNYSMDVSVFNIRTHTRACVFNINILCTHRRYISWMCNIKLLVVLQTFFLNYSLRTIDKIVVCFSGCSWFVNFADDQLCIRNYTRKLDRYACTIHISWLYVYIMRFTKRKFNSIVYS